jgi:hypothetical protein
MKRILELSHRMGEFGCCEMREAATRAPELERTLQEKEQGSRNGGKRCRNGGKNTDRGGRK